MLKKQISLDKFSVMTLGKYVSAMKPYIENERFQRKTQITSREYSTNIPTRPEVSEGDPPIASLIQVVPSEEPRDTDRLKFQIILPEWIFLFDQFDPVLNILEF